MDPEVFDRRSVRRHRDRAARTVGSVADVLLDAAGRLLDRLDDTTQRFTQALDVGGRGVVAPLLRARGIIDYGIAGTESEFFEIRLKDKYASAALASYAEAAAQDDSEWGEEVAELSRRAGLNSPWVKKPD